MHPRWTPSVPSIVFVLMFGWFHSTAHPEWPLLLIFSLCLNYVSNEVLLRNELGYVFHQTSYNKTVGGLEVLCVCCKLCLFCMLSRKDVSQCQLFIRAAIFIYPDAWKVGVLINWPNASLHFRPYKGKKTPLLRKQSKCSGPQRCHFYLFLFIFSLCNYDRCAVLNGRKVSLTAAFALIGRVLVLFICPYVCCGILQECCLMVISWIIEVIYIL